MEWNVVVLEGECHKCYGRRRKKGGTAEGKHGHGGRNCGMSRRMEPWNVTRERKVDHDGREGKITVEGTCLSWRKETWWKGTSGQKGGSECHNRREYHSVTAAEHANMPFHRRRMLKRRESEGGRGMSQNGTRRERGGKGRRKGRRKWSRQQKGTSRQKGTWWRGTSWQKGGREGNRKVS